MFSSRASINHTRLRLGLSGLNGHRANFSFIDFSYCNKCGYELEDTIHFFLFCTNYAAQRETLFTSLDTLFLDNIVKPHRNLNTRRALNTCITLFLKGDPTWKLCKNIELFTAVQIFIQSTQRLL